MAKNALDSLPLYEGAQPCVRSGYCCNVRPCPFGESRSASDPGCRHLVGDAPGQYACGIYDQIVGQPGWQVAPAFGGGCCSPLNPVRRALLRRTPSDNHASV